MKKNLIYSIVSVMIAIAATSCSEEIVDQGLANSDGIFRLSSDKGAFTRATGNESTFEAGTAYQLYAIENNDFSVNYLKNPASAGAIIGTEAADHNSIEGIQINKFNNKTLNFYAVTNSTSKAVEIATNGDEAPTCNIRYEDSMTPLTDVMWAKKENQSYQNAGVIKMLFGHTLSKLNLYVMKHSDYASSKVVLNDITLTDYPSGTLNMQTGKYNLNNNDQRSQKCTVYAGGEQVVSTTDAAVQKDGAKVTPMIFPTRKEKLEENDRKNHSLWVTVGVTIGSRKTTKEIEITSTLAEGAGNSTKEVPFNFESNHEYDMVITITKSSLVVTIVPRVYDWIPEEELKADDEVNGSMTIGGITWMDRNLGATSGNPLAGDQAWENSRGYYYQFGRNIPYYVKPKRDSKGIMAAPSHGNLHEKESMPYPFIPGKENEEPKKTNTYANADKAVNPSDIGKKYLNFFHRYKRQWGGDTFYGENWDSDNGNSDNWKEPKNQPCPKGWRLPTVNEFRLIIPANEDAGDITFSTKKHENNKNTFFEETSNDPTSGDKSRYVGVEKSNTLSIPTAGITNTIYALKKANSNNAYFLRWHIERAGKFIRDNRNTNSTDKGDDYRNVLVISRYPATSKSTLTSSNVSTAAKWDYPVEQVILPISGYIHTDSNSEINGGADTDYRPALIYSGTEAVYWTSSPIGDDKSYTVRMKFGGNAYSSQIMIYNDEIRSNGCLIRCVRDTKAD